MINLTIIYLASSTSLSHSPAFVNNRISFLYGNLKHFSSLIFYNQHNLLISNSKFNKILNGIIYNSYEELKNQHENIQNKTFNSNILTLDSTERSVSIINCQFMNIKSDYSIKVSSDKVSLYITHSLFTDSNTDNGIINLPNCRCLTMTHICCSQCQSKVGFLFYNCKMNDFSIILYNTVIDSILRDSSDTAYLFKANYGDQYYRCNNVTNCGFNGFHFDAIQCFSFGMNTILNCERNCIQLSGEIITEKIIENSNFICKENGNIIVLAGKNVTTVKIISCVISHINGNNNNLISRHDVNYLTISFIDCLISKKFQVNDAVTENCSLKETNEITIKLMPHYTYENVCNGEPAENENAAYDCNAGKCIDSICNKTIGFPEGVVPYTTIVYGDLQTLTFSPTQNFTHSNEFSESIEFSESEKFTKSSDFPSTMMFSKSIEFTKSDRFSKTNYFSDSFLFSKSIDFSKSEIFSDSNSFNIFTASIIFSKSESFSKSLLFTKSLIFSKSLTFSKSLSFSESLSFSMSETLVKNDDGKQGDGGKGGLSPATIGAIAGVAIAAVVAAILAFIFIRKRKRINMTSDPNLIETNDNFLTVENDLDNIMNEDDPFAAEFK